LYSTNFLFFYEFFRINQVIIMNGESLILFFIIAVVLVGGGIVFASIVAPRSFNSQKFEPYECGIPTRGTTWIQFSVGYYLFAIIYLVFDVETVFLFPWGVVMKSNGIQAFVEIIIFFFILGLGLLYAWKKGALKWV